MFQSGLLSITLDLNLPLTGIAFGLVLLFLRVRSPEGSMKAKLGRVDWLYVSLHPFFVFKHSNIFDNLAAT